MKGTQKNGSYGAKRALFSVLGIRNYNYKGEGGGG